MPQPNIKLYLILSGVLIVIFLIILLIPLGNRMRTPSDTSSIPTPTSIQPNTQINPSGEDIFIEPAPFTGVEDEELPPAIASQSQQKQELRGRVPFDTGLFALDFDYGEDKFIVILNAPQSENLSQFEEWKRINFPDIPMNQFIFR